MSPSLPEFVYVDSQQKLECLCKALSGKPYIAIDTEFLRERTYRPQLCLIQIKVDDILACVDTQQGLDLAPLLAILLDDGVTKVLHAASQDLEICYMLARKVPSPIFDTQLAAPLLGYNEQIGYGNLVREHLGIELPKAHTRADWTRRPLPPKQIAYALDDVIYLEQLYLDMRDKLESMGRLAWLAPEFAAAAEPKKFDQPAGERWLKIRNIQRYKGPVLSSIQALAQWREIKARELDRPRNWLIKDDVLCALAQQHPHNIDELAHIRSLDRKTRERFGEELVDLIKTSRETDPQPLPAFIKKKKLDDVAQTHVALLHAWTHQKANELAINPGLLASQKTLEKCVSAGTEEALQGWRGPLLRDEFESILSGEKSIRSTPRGLILQ